MSSTMTRTLTKITFFFHFRYNRALVWDEEEQRESPEWWRNLVARCSHKNRTTSRNNFRWRDEQWDENKDNKGVRKILVRGSMPPCCLRWRKFWKFAYERVHSGVYLNKYVVSIAPFYTSACLDCSQSIQKTAFFMFSLFVFSSIFPGGGQLTPFAPMCGRPWKTRHQYEIKINGRPTMVVAKLSDTVWHIR